MRIRVIGAPMDLGADRRGVDIGTSAIRYAGINERLRSLGHSVKDMGNLVIPQPEIQPQGNLKLKYLDPIVGISKELSTIVTTILQEGEFPVIVGARDLDRAEQDLLRAHSIHVFTMSEIDRVGISEIMQRAIVIAGQQNDGIHLSLDMDALDPKEAPGVGTPVRGGLTYREAHLAMEMIASMGNLVSMDVVEVNPILDRENATASLAVELVLSALGKKIF